MSMIVSLRLVRMVHVYLHVWSRVKSCVGIGLRELCWPNSTGASIRYAPTITGGKISHCSSGVTPMPKIIGMLTV